MQVKTQPDELQNYLTDASNMQGGHAERLFIPESAEEIGAILKLEVGTVKAHMARAVARLRVELKDLYERRTLER